MGLRTGAEYLAGLRDGRQIIYDGRRIADVTTEPGFRNTARAVAQYYDLQHVPAVRELVSYETPDGDRAPLSCIEPRSKEDLRRRATAFAAWAEVTCGHMGRSPDYMNACLMAVGAARPHWGAKDPVLWICRDVMDPELSQASSPNLPPYFSLALDEQALLV